MGKSTTQKIKVGIFVVVGTIILVVALYFIGSRQQMFTKNIQLYAVFQNVGGLQLGNNVRYSGINVGTVTHIEMTEIGRITVELSIAEKAASFIKTDGIASINSDGLVGSMVVNIVPGPTSQATVVVSGDTIGAYNSMSTQEMMETLNKTNENAALLTADLLIITNQIVAGKGTLGALISDSVMAQNIQGTVVALKNTIEGANLAVAKVNQLISKINYDESAAALILSDTSTTNQFRTVFENLEKSSNDIKTITKNLDYYLVEIKTGKGAINHLTQDEDFVREIDSTMISIKEAADKLNQNMEAMKHNFLFHGYFKKQEKKANQAKKEEN